MRPKTASGAVAVFPFGRPQHEFPVGDLMCSPAVHPRFHSRNSPIHGDTGRRWMDRPSDKAQVDGTIR